MALFDLIGKKYDGTRKADPSMSRRLIKLLDLQPGKIVADIGAGTGNYSEVLADSGYKVIAIEPSKTMREQGKQHSNLFWLEGFAEDIPLKDGYVDGIVCLAAVHHFSDRNKAFAEMSRILKPGGKAVIFGADHKSRKSLWLDDYFRPTQSTDYPSAKKVADELEKAFDSKSKTEYFPIPAEVQDCFFVSGWRRPWFYLDNTFCANISPLAKAPKEELNAFQEKLRKDIFSGKWEKKYGKILKKKTFDGGYYFITITKPLGH